MSQRIVSVYALVHYLKGKLDSDHLLQRILVQGEISNFTNHRSGHWYFTLKDERARISCVMFQSYARQCGFVPKDGDKVILTANTSLFESSGQLQLYGVKMQLDGLGELYLKFELLKKKLLNEGLFDQSKKKRIPSYPMKIGLVTGKNTAAREDVVSTIKRRWPVAEIAEFATLVQGEAAPEEIIDALMEADASELDVILLVRGGGSIEDLWAFNSEELARVISSLNTPIICGVGHEVDVTIADYVCDLRAPTPTGAAEMAVPDVSDVLSSLNKDKTRLIQAVGMKLSASEHSLRIVSESRIFRQPEMLLEGTWMKLDHLELKLKQTIYRIQEKQTDYTQLKNRMTSSMLDKCHGLTQQLNMIDTQLKNSITERLNLERRKFIEKATLLDAYSPLKSLSRGYSLAYIGDQLITSVNQIKRNDEITLRLHDGKIKAVVLEKENKHEQ